MIRKHNYGIYLNLILGIVFVLFFYQKIITNPNGYIFTDWGDGIKNYYTYTSYINNNTSTWNLEGLNYPYGENIFYTDCHPILALSIKKLSAFFPYLADHAIGIINFAMIFSLVFTSLLSYLILRHYKLPQFLSACAAFSIMVLSPQIGRITGHLALSYSFFIPLTIYLLIKYEADKKYRWMMLQSLNIFFWLTIHAYLGMIAASLLLAFYGIKYAMDFKTYKKNSLFYFNIFVQAILPIIIFRVIILLTDTHIGRTDNPWGFFATRANLASVFLPHHKPLNIIYVWLGYTPNMRWEGWSYIGITSVIVCISYIVLLIRKSIINKKWLFTTPYFKNKQLQIILLSGILILLFSMAFPFKYGLEFLLDWVSSLKQFRATGRFAWVFFFIINYIVIIYLYTLFKESKFKKIALIGLILFPLLNTIEGWSQHNYYSNKIVSQKNLFKKEQLPEYFKEALSSINSTDYQAIISFPFYYVGGENYGREGNNKAFFATELTSYHTLLPILGSHLTRNGIQEAKNINQVISPLWYKKEIIKDIKSDKPFLLVKTSDKLNPYEEGILERSTRICGSKEMAYYEISYDNLLKFNSDEAIQNFITDSCNLIKNGEFLSNDSANLIYQNFDELKSDYTFRGPGAFQCRRKVQTKIITFNGDSLILGANYIVSFWIYNCGKNFGQDILKINAYIESESKTGEKSIIASYRPSESTIIKDCWSLIEIPFKVTKPNQIYSFNTKGSKKPNQDIIIDELFIYKADTKNFKIIDKDSNTITNLFYNNHEIKH